MGGCCFSNGWVFNPLGRVQKYHYRPTVANNISGPHAAQYIGLILRKRPFVQSEFSPSFAEDYNY